MSDVFVIHVPSTKLCHRTQVIRSKIDEIKGSNVKKSSPKNLSADCRPTVHRQVTDSLQTANQFEAWVVDERYSRIDSRTYLDNFSNCLL